MKQLLQILPILFLAAIFTATIVHPVEAACSCSKKKGAKAKARRKAMAAKKAAMRAKLAEDRVASKRQSNRRPLP